MLDIVTIHIYFLFVKSTTLRPGGPAGPPGSGKRVGISKTPAIGEKIRGDNDFFSNVREKYYTSHRGPTGPWAQGR